MFHRMLVNPAYAGTFVYGRVRREIAAGDPPVATTRRLPLEEWSIVIQGIYPGLHQPRDLPGQPEQAEVQSLQLRRQGARSGTGGGRRCCRVSCIAGDAAARWA